MKAAIFKGVKQMACEEHAEPTIIDGGDAIIRVVRACVCGSDLWFYRDGSKEPNTQAGHEAIGVVEQIGDDVTVAKPGDFVIVPFPFSCGKCPVCKAGFESSCPHGGYFGDEGLGCQAEYLRVPEADGTLVVVPGDAKSFSDEMLASLLTLSDVMSTGYHAAASAEIKPGDTAVVFGDGAVGLCGVLSAKLMGATRIISMSRHADRQRIAREFGATDFVEERGDEAVAKVLEMTDGYGADAVLECVGSALSNDTAMKVARAGAVVGRVGARRGSRYSRTVLPQRWSARRSGTGAHVRSAATAQGSARRQHQSRHRLHLRIHARRYSGSVRGHGRAPHRKVAAAHQ